jgi:membrane protease YdiL (CAAX protease family)
MAQRLSAPWHPLEAIPVGLAAFAVAAIVSVAIVVPLGVGGVALLLVGLAFQAALAGFTILWVSLRHRGSLPALGLRTDRAATDIVTGAFSGILIFALAAFAILPALTVIITALSGGPPDPISQPVVPEDPGAVEVAVSAFVVLVGAPVGEEIFFRGFLYGGLRSRFGFWASGAISAVLFAVFHAQFNSLLVPLMFFVGLAFAFLYERRGSLAATISAHAAFNLVGFTLIVLQRT